MRAMSMQSTVLIGALFALATTACSGAGNGDDLGPRDFAPTDDETLHQEVEDDADDAASVKLVDADWIADPGSGLLTDPVRDPMEASDFCFFADADVKYERMTAELDLSRTLTPGGPWISTPAAATGGARVEAEVCVVLEDRDVDGRLLPEAEQRHRISVRIESDVAAVMGALSNQAFGYYSTHYMLTAGPMTTEDAGMLEHVDMGSTWTDPGSAEPGWLLTEHLKVATGVDAVWNFEMDGAESYDWSLGETACVEAMFGSGRVTWEKIPEPSTAGFDVATETSWLSKAKLDGSMRFLVSAVHQVDGLFCVDTACEARECHQDVVVVGAELAIDFDRLQ